MTNGSDQFTLTFKRSDALLLARALMLSANAAMFEQRKGAEGRLREYQASFMEFAPEAARNFSGYVWCEMAMALDHATGFSVELAPAGESGWWREGYIFISVNSAGGSIRRFRSSDFRHPRGSDRVEATYRAVLELAPIGIEGTFDPADMPSFMKSTP